MLFLLCYNNFFRNFLLLDISKCFFFFTFVSKNSLQFSIPKSVSFCYLLMLRRLPFFIVTLHLLQKEQLKEKMNKLQLLRSKLLGNSLLLGDMMVLLTAVGAAESEGCSVDFCHQLGVRVKAMKEIRKLRLHLTNAGCLFSQD